MFTYFWFILRVIRLFCSAVVLRSADVTASPASMNYEPIFGGVELHCLSLSTVCGLSLLSCRLMLLLHRRARTDGQNDGHFFFLVGKRGYRLKEHFHMKNHEAITTTSIDMTSGLLSDDDDWPCCIAAGCSPVPFQRKKSPQKRKKEKRVSR